MNVITSKLSNNCIQAVDISILAQQCHISVDDLDSTTENELLEFLQSAQSFLEEKYNIVFGINSFQSVFKLRNENKIYLPKYPVNNVSSPEMHMLKGESTTLCLLPQHITSDNYVVEYECGWTRETIPYEVIQSLKMLVSYYYNNRDAQQEKQLYSPAFAVEALMCKYNSQTI